jgi:5-carboxymethyl-2-hydroxymuconate isomerase
MPHIIVEYANNLEARGVDIPELLEVLSTAAINTGLFHEAGLRARAYCASHQRVAQGDPDLSFLHLAMNVGKGRSIDDRQLAGEAIFEVLKNHLAAVLEKSPLTLSFEMREIDDVKFNFRNF